MNMLLQKEPEFREYQSQIDLCRCFAYHDYPVDSLVHTDYRQAVAATGRLSSNNPNRENIPIRTEKDVRLERLSFLEMKTIF